MTIRAKTPQLHLLPILNLLRIAISPLQRHFAVGICIHQHVECAICAIERGEEGHGGGDLAEERLDLGLDLGVGFGGVGWGCGGGGRGAEGVLVVGWVRDGLVWCGILKSSGLDAGVARHRASKSQRGSKRNLLSSTTIIRRRILLIRRLLRPTLAFCRRLIRHLHLHTSQISAPFTNHASHIPCCHIQRHTHVKLPPLHMLPCFLARDDNDQFRDLVANGPLAELGHDFLDVGFYLVVGCDLRTRLGWQAC